MVLVLFAALAPTLTVLDLALPPAARRSGPIARHSDRLREVAPKDPEEGKCADDQTDQDADEQTPRSRSESDVDGVSAKCPDEQRETDRDRDLQPHLEHVTTRDTSRSAQRRDFCGSDLAQDRRVASALHPGCGVAARAASVYRRNFV